MMQQFLLRVAVWLAAWLLLPVFLGAQTYTQTLKGVILDKAVKTPLIGATVQIISTETTFGAVADEMGRFRIERAPVGKHTLRVAYLGYKERIIPNVTVNSGKETDLSIELEESVLQGREVVISAKIDKQKPLNAFAAVSARTFSVEETQRFAAAVNDPARMVSAYAGVATQNDGNNTIVIRGNAPNGLLWRMEGVDIPNPNHFSSVGSSGGGISILSSQLLSNSDFMTGAFAAEYGNAMSGVFDLKMRKGNDEKYEFTFQAGVLGLDAAAEGPLRLGAQKGSFLFNYRYSTLSLLAELGVPLGDAVTNFQDLSFNIQTSAGKTGQFSLFGLGGLSRQTVSGKKDSLLWAKDEYNRYNSVFLANTGVVGLTHSKAWGKTYWKNVVAISRAQNGDEFSMYRKDYTRRMLEDGDYDQRRYTYSSVLSRKFSARHYLRSGFYFNRYQTDMAQKEWFDDGQRAEEQIAYAGHLHTANAFAQWQYRPAEKLTFNGGLHAFAFLMNRQYSLEPRASLKYAFSERRSLTFGYGLHSQMQALGVYFVKNAENGLLNQKLGLSKARHYVLAFDQSLGGNLRLKTEAYYQDLYKIPVSKGKETSFSMLNMIDGFVYEKLENTGRGRNYGLELTLEKFLTKGFYFLWSSSLYDSKYRGSDQIWRNTRFNGRYANNLVAGKEWNWNRGDKDRTFGVNIKLTQAGGLRESPIDIEASRAEGRTIYDADRAFEDQLPTYFRLDAGIRLKRNYARMTSSFAFDMQNASNRKNIGGRYFDTYTLEAKYYYQAPMIPVLSYKIEF